MNDDNNEVYKRFIPVAQWDKYHIWPSVAAMRNLIFCRKTNGFDEFNVVKKVAGRVLIDEAAFIKWVESHKS